MAASVADTMIGRLDACCAELLADIETKHHDLKKNYCKPANDDTHGGRSTKKSELRKSLSNISNTTKSLNLLSGYIESMETLRSKYVKYFVDSLRNEIEVNYFQLMLIMACLLWRPYDSPLFSCMVH